MCDRGYGKIKNMKLKIAFLQLLPGAAIEDNIEKGIRTVVDYELCGFAKCFNIKVNDLTDDYFNNLK